MSSRNSENKKEVIKELEKTISPVLVLNNSSLKPYVELFEYSPENIYQQPLGSLVGFFEVKEYSDDSAYIVNFLTSVLKKEYYINPKRPVTESLDSALHKVNMALSEVAKHGNVEWLGNLHAAICVLEKNNAHFSVAGGAKIFLYRNQALSDISDGLAYDIPEPHPLKTFVNVSSGRLENGDRLLITSQDIFHILPFEQLRKNLQRLVGDKFVQFLKTALSNQLEMIANVVIEMKEVETVPEAKMTATKKKDARAANVFSENTFAKTSHTNAPLEKPIFEIEHENKEEEIEYTDKKTGHIYVQGETNESDENNQDRLHRYAKHFGQANIYWDMTKEKIAQSWYLTKNNVKRSFSIYKKQLAKKIELMRIEREKQKQIRVEEKKHQQELKAIEDEERARQLAIEKEALEKQLAIENAEHEKQAALEKERELKMREEENIRQQQEQIRLDSVQQTRVNQETAEMEKTEEIQEVEPVQIEELGFREKLARAMKEERLAKLAEKGLELDPSAYHTDKTAQKIEPAIFIALKSKYLQATKLLKNIQLPHVNIPRINIDAKKISDRIIPHFSKIKKIFPTLTYKQKLYAFLALVLIFIVPIFIVRFINRPKPQTITAVAPTPPTLSEILTNDKNINLAPQTQTIFSGNDIINALVTDAGTVVTTKTSVIVISNAAQKEFPLPANSGNIIRTTYMHDLALMLLMTDQNKIISFSPISSKFAENKITLPENYAADMIGTYLTYLYILDGASNQIYRYPRADGGFGAKTDWLKDKTLLTGITDMTIDDSIYAIQNNQILKLFKGAAQPLTLEASKTPVHFDKIFTTIDSQSLYALDAKNSRLVQYSKADGTITAQYFNEKLGDSTSLSIDETNKTAYVSTSSELISISLQ